MLDKNYHLHKYNCRACSNKMVQCCYSRPMLNFKALEGMQYRKNIHMSFGKNLTRMECKCMMGLISSSQVCRGKLVHFHFRHNSVTWLSSWRLHSQLWCKSCWGEKWWASSSKNGSISWFFLLPLSYSFYHLCHHLHW